MVRKLVVEYGGVELAYAYSLLGLTEADVKDLEDSYLTYVEDTKLKPRKRVVKLVVKLSSRG